MEYTRGGVYAEADAFVVEMEVVDVKRLSRGPSGFGGWPGCPC